ncbi:hypothetical protein [Candidatus Symbiopectobacterium sp. NZEC135]|uniref:hypothetical protein n=1 Tax=Candidatus Symbiopectobacterium sp. NZEC135 TaxID=2820471 RepID=UPI002227DA95|nr:hypothetical protein [Candidatus Symbiopectobacterium sp. NZEC135]MCW2481707.1 hypothetical protein [Candidatus Symbiopectobacterium sp. NZEC135]
MIKMPQQMTEITYLGFISPILLILWRERKEYLIISLKMALDVMVVEREIP